jgi:hypothetical protein
LNDVRELESRVLLEMDSPWKLNIRIQLKNNWKKVQGFIFLIPIPEKYSLDD